MHQKTSHERILDLVYIAAGAAIIAVCSWLCIPLTVPVTMQTFAVFFIITLFGGRRGTASVLVYLLLGAVGVPVFAEFSSGIGVLFGMTGGYLLGFVFIGLIAWGFESLFGRKYIPQVTALVLGLAVCYAFGTAWFMVVYAREAGAVTLAEALGWCVIPFIFPDIIKLLLAQTIARRVAPLLSAQNSAISA
ncbi:MAG: biotin transporter BioY [Oscillospiraceae bacterium]|nr:biotin transporter BioY [Oscillospiraceae bacterium]